MKTKALFFLHFITFALVADESFISNGKTCILTPQGYSKQTKEGEVVFYKDEMGNLLGVSKRIIVKFRPGADKEAILKAANLTKERDLGDNMAVVSSQSIGETFEACKTLQSSPLIEFAHPDFLKQKKTRALEPLYNELWHLENNGQFGGILGADINIKEAWKITKGIGGKIAIIDDGFDLNHEDLKDAIIAQKDFSDDDDNASFNNTAEYHGTLCAGIALARENGKGVAGVAPRSSLMAVKSLAKESDGTAKMVFDSDFVDAFFWAKNQGADVISCSWGTYDVSDAVKSAIENVSSYGRGGRGIPVFFASGNDGEGQSVWINDEAALESVISVGSSTNQNIRAPYSNYGYKLDLVAPSGNGFISGPGIATTDISGDLGHVSNSFGHSSYTYASDSSGFHGTSASAPMAAAVAALMLGINPELTKSQAQSILQNTADKIGYTTYSNGRNDYYGYGKINAGKAVLEARELSSFVQNLSVKAGVWSILSLYSNQIVYDLETFFGQKTWRAYAWDSSKSNWKIWASDRSCAQIESAGFECLSELNPGDGFFITNYGSSGDSTISVRGGKTNEETPVLKSGWNLVGFGSNKTFAQLKSLYGNSIVVWKMQNGQYVKITDDAQIIGITEGVWIKL